jgi:hypothetical protein
MSAEEIGRVFAAEVEGDVSCSVPVDRTRMHMSALSEEVSGRVLAPVPRRGMQRREPGLVCRLDVCAGCQKQFQQIEIPGTGRPMKGPQSEFIGSIHVRPMPDQ